MYLQPLLQVYNVFFYLVLYVCYITFKRIFFLIEKKKKKRIQNAKPTILITEKLPIVLQYFIILGVLSFLGF